MTALTRRCCRILIFIWLFANDEAFAFTNTFVPTTRTAWKAVMGNPLPLLSPCQSRGLPMKKKRSTTAAMESSSDENEATSAAGGGALDNFLAQVTSAFPLFVLATGFLALQRPTALTWVSRGDIITNMLAGIMVGTGLTLEKKDFTDIFAGSEGKDWVAIPLGVLCQYIIMPLTACLVGRAVLLPAGDQLGKPLFLGLCLVGCSPGGTASNLVTLIAKADVALSVTLTTASTVLAVLMTPLLTKWLVGSTVTVSVLALCQATARVILAPILAGMILNAKFPVLSKKISRFTPAASVLLVSLIAGGVLAQNAATLLMGAGAATLWKVLTAVLALHSIGFAMGYGIPKWLAGQSERSSRTISIEVGMQNAGLAVVLARSVSRDALATLPGAFSVTINSCLASLLAAVWCNRPVSRTPQTDKIMTGDQQNRKQWRIMPPKENGDNDDSPDYSI